MKARDEGRGGEVGGGGGGKQPVPEEPRQPQTQAPPTHGYSRYGQEKFRGQEGEKLLRCFDALSLIENVSVDL